MGGQRWIRHSVFFLAMYTAGTETLFKSLHIDIVEQSKC